MIRTFRYLPDDTIHVWDSERLRSSDGFNVSARSLKAWESDPTWPERWKEIHPDPDLVLDAGL